MLSPDAIERKRIYEICESSGEIKPGDTFKDCIVADELYYSPLTNEDVICCGAVSDDEILFRTADGSYYFSLLDGWGSCDGILYGLSFGLEHDFKRPTTPETIIAECEADRGTYNSWAGAMSWQARGQTLDKIISVMKRQSDTSPAS